MLTYCATGLISALPVVTFAGTHSLVLFNQPIF